MKIVALLLLSLEVIWGPLPAPADIRCHDGDTIIMDLKGLPQVFGRGISLRLSGIDCPEIRDADPVVRAHALKARKYLADRIDAAKKVQVLDAKRDKYFRLNGRLLLDGVDMSKEMIDKGFAKPYDGGTKQPWKREDIK